MKTDPPNNQKSFEQEFLSAFQEAFAKPGEMPAKVDEFAPVESGIFAGTNVVSNPDPIKSPQKKSTDDPLTGITITVSPDRMTALLRGDHARFFTAEAILLALRQQRIIYGIDLDILRKTVENLSEDGSWTGEEIVARGTPAKNGAAISSPIFDLDVSPQSGNPRCLIEGQELPFDRLEGFIREESLTSQPPLDFKVKAVRRGEVLALVSSETKAEPGCDVHGAIVHPEKQFLCPGDHVKQNEQNGNYEAMIFGYLDLDGNRLTVLPPLIITADLMAVYFVSLPQVGSTVRPSPAEIQMLLMLEGINSNCFLIKQIKMLCETANPAEFPTFLKIASGSPALDGRNADFIPAIVTEKQAGTIREDDSIDLKERNILRSVDAGDFLGEKILSTPGRAGYDIFGKKRRAVDGHDVNILTNGAITIQKKPDRILYYARNSGNITFRNNTLILTEIFRVDGNVDYASGNIEVKTALQVKGSVMPGFKVKAKGATIIGGAVENGGIVLVEGDLKVANGIIGEKTRIVVMGSLQAKYIQDAEVIVKGDITIESYIFGGRVMSGGEIAIKRSAGRQEGKVIGAFICAVNGISVSTVGSPSNQNSVMAIQRDPRLLEEMNQTNQEIIFCSENISKMMRTLQLGSVSAEAIREMLGKVPDTKKELFMKILDNLNKFIKRRKFLSEKVVALEAGISKTLNEAKIRVTTEFFLGNQVRIGDKNFTANDDLGPSIFQLKDDRIIH
ncbi:MAG: FapA family protein [Proteobacteria bacterium]|nr:FapA family protein [Pseudomonadota bacterium]MBU1688435.1 FapA family protein [Pseudomonadota bacterium]